MGEDLGIRMIIYSTIFAKTNVFSNTTWHVYGVVIKCEQARVQL